MGLTRLNRNHKLASHIVKNRATFGAAIYEAFGTLEDWRLLTNESGMDRAAIIEHMICTQLDFLAKYVRTGHEACSLLFVGAQLKIFNNMAKVTALRDLTVKEFIARYRSVLQTAAAKARTFSDDQREALDEALLTIFTGVGMPLTKTVKVLLIGDCLFDEVNLFLNAYAVSHGWQFISKQIISKNPVEQRQILQTLHPADYQMVVFSPFSYEFAQEYRQILQLRNALMSKARLEALIKGTKEDTRKTLDLLADNFDAPIFVHNSSTLQRGANWARLMTKILLTHNVRLRAKRLINPWLNEYVARKNQESFKHLFVFDEDALVDGFGTAMRLGTYYNHAQAIHLTHFSEAVARKLMTALEAKVLLMDKKVVVCDLDNTLWAGVIGEGRGVEHYKDRQGILRDLKGKGVVLAINSKNDPANISWDHGVLKADDFVAAQISWRPKVQGMKVIQSDLNLKLKDFVFIDDRMDECAMMQAAYPEIGVLDANESRTWQLLQQWTAQLDEPDMDRTQMYKDREKRRELTRTNSTIEDPSEMFRKLELKVLITKAGRADLKRVTELVNRTNQWNTTGARTTIKEVCGFHDARDYTIYTVNVADRFGEMGMICTAIIRQTSEALEIPIFVLSCRVFGYGIESMLLDCIKQASYKLFGAVKVNGIFKPTAHNSPAANMFKDNGFQQCNEKWLCRSESFEARAPAWLECLSTP